MPLAKGYALGRPPWCCAMTPATTALIAMIRLRPPSTLPAVAPARSPEHAGATTALCAAVMLAALFGGVPVIAQAQAVPDAGSLLRENRRNAPAPPPTPAPPLAIPPTASPPGSDIVQNPTN